ncbi:VOC family protein [Amycolatopsis pithecellobii]|uniref:Glyoxalase n=1 Tax=Amycolatopsis pithecellobii TaxID=664692 RepID=A0A6N7Z4M7_9PSEU|nr:VOC family protein [Amycolatopsis pithecellobii]MTD55441.1 glyoxalase [Amycolatopsis pithecellobii]
MGGRSKEEIVELGHTGLFTNDLDNQVAFYRDVLGLQITDEAPENGIVFMSSRPDAEHHELLLASGRDVERDVHLVQQIAWRCGSLAGLKALYGRIVDAQAPIDMVVSHGNAIGVYFRDPEGNRLEVYWQTGLEARQPFLYGIDLTLPEETLLAEVRERVAKFGQTGYIDEAMLAEQEVGQTH